MAAVTEKRFSVVVLVSLILIIGSGAAALGQTTAFKYQGSLTDGGSAANGSFQMQFKLFDAVSGGAQVGSTLTDLPITATNGVFSVSLDFGTSALNGANRWIEIAVRRNSGESYVTLSPRERISSAPYAVRTLSAATADTALDSQKLGGVAASEYVTNATGGTTFIKNQTTQQPSSNFNISGDGSAARMFVGAPTALPGSAKLTVNSGGFGITHHNNTVSIQSLINADTGFIGTTSSHPFGFLAGGTERMRIGTNGNVGIGTTAPTHTLDVNGFFRAVNVAGGNVVSETTGGTNSWAKFWLRTPAHSWSIGSSNNFGGNQLYIQDETSGQFRMSIMPNGFVGIGTTNPNSGLEVRGTGSLTQQRITDDTSGNSLVLQGGAGSNMKVTGYNYGTDQAVPLHLSVDGANTVVGGNITQAQARYGLPKATVYLNGDGTILRCYNGITGATSGGCGFGSSRPGAGSYLINFGFALANRFVVATPESICCQGFYVGLNFGFQNATTFYFNVFTIGSEAGTDRPLMVAVY
jgi:hypothetical protein